MTTNPLEDQGPAADPDSPGDRPHPRPDRGGRQQPAHSWRAGDLESAGLAAGRALADAQGRFVFRDLPKGNYGLTTTKPGHVDGAYGRLRPSGRPCLSISATASARPACRSPVWRYAAIAGFVQDELGEPVVNTAVRVLRRQIVGGQWRFVPGAQDQTDDRGAHAASGRSSRANTRSPSRWRAARACRLT